MDQTKIKAPAGLCGYHRRAWKSFTARGWCRVAQFAQSKCHAGSQFCTWEWESGR
jgi:hypothetical protein